MFIRHNKSLTSLLSEKEFDKKSKRQVKFRLNITYWLFKMLLLKTKSLLHNHSLHKKSSIEAVKWFNGVFFFVFFSILDTYIAIDVWYWWPFTANITILSPLNCESRATPDPVTPPPITSTSNSLPLCKVSNCAFLNTHTHTHANTHTNQSLIWPLTHKILLLWRKTL